MAGLQRRNGLAVEEVRKIHILACAVGLSDGGRCEG